MHIALPLAMARGDTETTEPVDLNAESANHRTLHVFGPQGLDRYPLPSRGEITIGRSPECLVCIDDRMVSRRHAVLCLGTRTVVRDLGSANGTWLGDRRLCGDEEVELSTSDVLRIGSTLVALHGPVPVPPRAPATVGDFELRTREQCASACGRSVGLLRVRLHQAAAEPLVEALLERLPQPADCFVRRTACEYEVLLVKASPAGAEA